MAYISQEEKKQLAPAIKGVLKKYGLKGSIAIRHHSALVVSVASGPIDFGCDERGYLQLSGHVGDKWDEDAKECLTELVAAMKGDGWYDKSEPMTDYFNVAYYITINIGRFDKHYVCTKSVAA